MEKNSKNQLEEFARQCFALSSPIRIKILQLLAERDHCACEFPVILNISQPNASRNLNVLKKAGLIQSNRDGQRIIYSLQIKNLHSVQHRLNELIDSYTGLAFTSRENKGC